MQVIAGTPEADRVGRLLNELRWQVHHTLNLGDPSSVHDLRVSIRRVRQALIAFFPDKPPKKLRTSLKTMLTLAGRVRDCDITIALLDKSRMGGLEGLRLRCQRQRADAWLILIASLERWLTRTNCVASPQSPLEETARRVLPVIAKDFFRRGAAALNGASAKELHKFRIAAKKFRYTLELFGSNLNRLRERVEKIQTLLGRINDYESARRLAARLGGGKKIDAHFRKKQKKKIKAFHDHWTRELAHELRQRSRDELRNPMVAAAGQVLPISRKIDR